MLLLPAVTSQSELAPPSTCFSAGQVYFIFVLFAQPFFLIIFGAPQTHIHTHQWPAVFVVQAKQAAKKSKLMKKKKKKGLERQARSECHASAFTTTSPTNEALRLNLDVNTCTLFFKPEH